MATRLFQGLLSLATILSMTGCGNSPSGGRTLSGDKETAHDAGTRGDKTPASSDTEAAGDACATGGTTSMTPSAWSLASVVIERECVACHTSRAPLLTTPELTRASAEVVLASVEAGRMPPAAPLSAADQATIKAWADAPVLALLADPLTYEKDIKPIIDAKCAWCHSPTAANNVRETPYLSTYAEVRNRAGASEGEMRDGKMPPKNRQPQLAPGDLAKFQQWIADGRLQGTPRIPIDPALPVYYLDTMKDALVGNCVGCHAAGGESPMLTTYEEAKLAAGLSATAVEQGRMPPSAPLATDLKTAFRAWVAAGSPQDAASAATEPKPATDVPDASTSSDCAP